MMLDISPVKAMMESESTVIPQGLRRVKFKPIDVNSLPVRIKSIFPSQNGLNRESHMPVGPNVFRVEKIVQSQTKDL